MKTSEVQKFAEFLKESRVKVGLTQKELARRLGLQNSQFISNWERGACLPPLWALKKLLTICHLSKDQVFQFLVNAERERITLRLRKEFAQND